MIDSENLRTASLYINNQLLSRGLLRDGQHIDFADPTAADGGIQATMGQVMSVVNDLILRRDRDAASRESVSTTLRAFRAEAQRNATDLARQSEKLAEAQRRLDSADATERALRAQVKTAEQNANKLKEELSKTKTLVAQTRTACATEVRRRDRQIDGLKKTVADAGRVRGGNKSRDVVVISVTGNIGAEEEVGAPQGATQDEAYSLKMETNAFLTDLARGLSEENESVLTLVRHTVEQLREMSGLEGTGNDAMGSQTRRTANDAVNMAPPKGAEELATELEEIVSHLKNILTNPSFVPIEEVEIRDDEINRLRQGWERMESRWKDAVYMIDGWRQRMLSSGRGVDMEELNMGLRLSPVRVREAGEPCSLAPMRLSRVQEEEEEGERADEGEGENASQALYEPGRHTKSPSQDGSLHLIPAPGYEVEDADNSDTDSSVFQDDLDIEELEAEEPNVEILQASVATSIDSPPLPVPPRLSPLKDSYSAGNRRSGNHNSYHKTSASATVITGEYTTDLPAGTASGTLAHGPHSDQSTQPTSAASYDTPLFSSSNGPPSPSKAAGLIFSKPTASATKSDPNTELKTEPRQTRARKAAPSNPTAGSGSQALPAKRTASDPHPAPTAQPREEKAVAPIKHSKSAPRAPSPTRGPVSSRLPRPNNPPTQQSPLTMAAIAAKLAASERDADAARVRAKLKAARMGKRLSEVAPVNTNGSGPQAPADGDAATHITPEEIPLESSVDPVKKHVPAVAAKDELAMSNASTVDTEGGGVPVDRPEKRRREPQPAKRRTSKVAARRRSTLSPWELESLIQGNVNVDSPAR